MSVEINRQRRLVVTTAGGEHYEVEVRKEGERLFRTLVPVCRGLSLVTFPTDRSFIRRNLNTAAIAFQEPGRE